jgi:hypothetical protein
MLAASKDVALDVNADDKNCIIMSLEQNAK